jgi:fructose-bisphosphate aldolase, class II
MLTMPGVAIPAFNVFNLEQVRGVFLGASAARAPVIVQISRVAAEYAGLRLWRSILEAAEDEFQDVVFGVHHDHGDESSCHLALESGVFSSVMIDASHLSFDENVAVTARVVQAARRHRVWVEAELGTLAGAEDDMTIEEHEARMTEPDAAEAFVAATGCDALAVAVGNSHGAYKHTAAGGLRLERLRAIHERLPAMPLVLHGSSSVPADEVERIRQSGGKMDPAAGGVPHGDVLAAAGMGVRKINVATDARLVWTRAHREYFRDYPDGVDLCVPGRTFMKDFAAYVAARCESLGLAGQVARFVEQKTVAGTHG